MAAPGAVLHLSVMFGPLRAVYISVPSPSGRVRNLVLFALRCPDGFRRTRVSMSTHDVMYRVDAAKKNKAGVGGEEPKPERDWNPNWKPEVGSPKPEAEN